MPQGIPSARWWPTLRWSAKPLLYHIWKYILVYIWLNMIKCDFLKHNMSGFSNEGFLPLMNRLRVFSKFPLGHRFTKNLAEKLLLSISQIWTICQLLLFLVFLKYVLIKEALVLDPSPKLKIFFWMSDLPGFSHMLHAKGLLSSYSYMSIPCSPRKVEHSHLCQVLLCLAYASCIRNVCLASEEIIKRSACVCTLLHRS